MVVSVSRPASEVGLQILDAGGNAVDAAIAVGFALQVTWPEAGNIGGGGFMLVHPADGKPPTLFEYREKAPAAATVDMFAHEKPSEARLVGVPGTVRGLELAHKRFGKLPWKGLVAPAVELAKDGFVVSEELASSLNGIVESCRDNPEFLRVYGKDNGTSKWKLGDHLVQTDLAETLTAIANEGAAAFYTGKLAEVFEAEMQRSGGLITKVDLAAYRANERTPVHGTYKGYDVYASPPPSSGGTALIEMLNMAEGFSLKAKGRWSPQTLHIMIECMRRAYLDRARYLGDPDFNDIPKHLTSKDYAGKKAQTISRTHATSSAELGSDILTTEEHSNTTHFSIIDRDGMAVSNTYTLEDSFGSRIVVKGAGFLLNNEMGDFNPQPGVTNNKGLIGTKPNLVAPGKRMLSSMCPVVVAKDDKVLLITGSPGGRTIINTVFCLVLNVLEFEMPIREAVDAPRFHHQWMPDTVRLEKGLLDQIVLIEQLKAMGHSIDNQPTRQGDANSISVSKETSQRTGAADPRRKGWAAGQ
jgi:gamma-glutamyltranspeptidase/glutathione hydrolase